MTRRRRCALYVGALATVVATGCSVGDRPLVEAREDGDSSAVEMAQSAPASESPDARPDAGALDTTRRPALDPGALAMVPTVSAVDWTGPGGKPFEVARRTRDPAAQARRFGTQTMPIALRTGAPSVSQFPCTSCHLGRRMVLADDRVADAHRNISSAHPSETGGVCSTCHAPDDVELLTLKRGERATLDHAYRLCAQCHVGQVESWASGAHGKRLDGWRGRRVVLGCAECHDPHEPTLEPRIPFRAPQLQRPGGHDR
jgi:hypothetical protein